MDKYARPQRIRLSHAKGFNLQTHSRALNGLPARAVIRPGLFGNIYPVGAGFTRQQAVDAMRAALTTGCVLTRVGFTPSPDQVAAWRTFVLANIETLRGHNLACHCPLDQPCHADVLLELANAEPTQ